MTGYWVIPILIFIPIKVIGKQWIPINLIGSKINPITKTLFRSFLICGVHNVTHRVQVWLTDHGERQARAGVTSQRMHTICWRENPPEQRNKQQATANDDQKIFRRH